MSIRLSVCLNTQISVIIRARDTKIALKIYLYYSQIDYISYFGCHALHSHKKVKNFVTVYYTNIRNVRRLRMSRHKANFND